ncbi:MAG: type II toxin-antitoxin system RelE/ParE family toxin [Thermodesulfobacteriota bacterium]
MDITYKTNKMRKVFNSGKRLVQEYGAERAKKVMMRQDLLRAAPNLAQVDARPPTRRHELKGNRKGQFAVDLTGNYRLVFEPSHDPLPRKADGGLDLERITAITILSVEDYHND